ncbi:hypothetical protein RHMOL_Rhmol04G0215500 [Rhododendron molle]|uniref:Uncharacterized protein n=1 Tax=Rhododendron molle TaxID=49168 RepID=A0ACC0P2R2_RHOML|nr:hypothetical protein RHMOL_Rhmol04G0215500 [Rhododendron molle]
MLKIEGVTVTLPRTGRRAKQRLPAQCREGVAERGEDKEVEQEGGGDEVEEAPLAGVAFGGGEAQVARFCGCGGFSRSSHGDVLIRKFEPVLTWKSKIGVMLKLEFGN